MRLLLSLALKPGVVLPFQYQDALLSTLHRLLGRDNVLHDTPRSLYSFGALEGLRPASGGLVAAGKVAWQVAFHDPLAAAPLVQAAVFGEETDILPGLRIWCADDLPEPESIGATLRVLSPVLVQDWQTAPGRPRDHLLPDHPRHAEALTVTLRRKLADAGLPDDGCEARMLPRFKTKLIRLGGLDSRCAVAPVVITGTDEQRRFARTVGVGHSTGCGFGFLS